MSQNKLCKVCLLKRQASSLRRAHELLGEAPRKRDAESTEDAGKVG